MRESARAPLVSAVCGFVVAGLLVSSLAQAAVGHTSGSANVSDSGEGSYSIPILAPPGTRGMTPNLAFVSSHNSSSTLLGAGWSIAGLSAISRCPMLYAADGQVRDVRNDYSDRFCLNGKKLRLVSGTYGNAGAVYQTEIETLHASLHSVWRATAPRTSQSRPRMG